MVTLAFDIYGTLINPIGITDRLEAICGDRAAAFASLWREKQLEYTFRRALMQDYRDFSVCVRQALHFTADTYRVNLDAHREKELLDLYRMLPAFADAKRSLHDINQSEARVFALTNGLRKDAITLLEYNHLAEYFEDVISVDAVRTFKPDPAVYRYFIENTGTPPAACWLVSSNPFDVIGARHAGLHAAWIQRDKNIVFDPWDVQPDVTLTGLEKLQETVLDAGYNTDACMK